MIIHIGSLTNIFTDYSFLPFSTHIGQASTGMEICYNDKGDVVKHGDQYIPLGIDTCTQVRIQIAKQKSTQIGHNLNCFSKHFKHLSLSFRLLGCL